LGPQRFELAVFPHAGTWSEAGVNRAALEWAVPAVAHEDIPHKGELQPEFSLVEVRGDALFSTFKRSEDGRCAVLRLYNPSSREAEVEVIFGKPPARIWKARLDETEIEELPTGSTLKLRLGPCKVETLKLEF
jgi:alpha-mannosidase